MWKFRKIRSSYFRVNRAICKCTVLFRNYLLGDATAAPSGLFARLCHTFLVFLCHRPRTVDKPSRVMPTWRHLANRQYLQLVLLVDAISQFSPFVHMNFLCSCSLSMRRKKPCKQHIPSTPDHHSSLYPSRSRLILNLTTPKGCRAKLT